MIAFIKWDKVIIVICPNHMLEYVISDFGKRFLCFTNEYNFNNLYSWTSKSTKIQSFSSIHLFQGSYAILIIS